MNNMKKITKEDLCHGDVLLFTPHGKDWIARAIAFLTDGQVHHAALCYYEDIEKDDKCVMESLLNKGLVINYLKEKEERTFPAYVARLKKDITLEPVLKAAQSFYAKESHYPNANLVMLSILLLTRKFSRFSIEQAVFYDFLCLVSALLMDFMRQHGNESSMICSQFVAQCFTDSGKDYELDFEHLVIFDVRLKSDEKDNCVSLLEYMDTANIDIQSHVLSGCELENPEEIFQQFKNIVQKVPNTNDNAEYQGAIVSVTSEIKRIINEFCLHEFGVSFSPENFSTLRNYLVTPQDLYANTSSLEIIGELNYLDA